MSDKPRAAPGGDSLLPLMRSDAQAIGPVLVSIYLWFLSVLFDVRGPGHLKTPLDRLVDRAVALVEFERPVGLTALSAGNFQAVTQLDGGDAHQLFFALDAAFDVSLEVILCGDSARLQRAGQRARESTGEGSDNVVDRGGEGLSRLHLVERRVAAVHAKPQWLGEPLDMRLAQRALLLHNSDLRNVHELTHGPPPWSGRCGSRPGRCSFSTCRTGSAKKRPPREAWRGRSGSSTPQQKLRR